MTISETALDGMENAELRTLVRELEAQIEDERKRWMRIFELETPPLANEEMHTSKGESL